jgi:hypothetical protein
VLAGAANDKPVSHCASALLGARKLIYGSPGDGSRGV